MISEPRTCPDCGTALTDEPPESRCGRCLMEFGLTQDAEIEAHDSLELGPILRRNTSPLGVKFHQFEHYELDVELARGGMGMVFRAWQKNLNRHVALKFLLAHEVDSSESVRRFRTEAEANARLDHPNIVPIYQIGEVAGQHYLCLKLIRGGTLAAAMAKQRFSPLEAARFMAAVAGAVHYAHQRGVLHRDLKPGNILVDEQGQPQITDFGLARLMERDTDLTQTGAVIGTPSYMSPEQAAGGTRVLTTASDIYSLGAILYELLTGRPPFEGRAAHEIIAKVREGRFEPPRMRQPSIPRDLDIVCRKCLERDPANRYPTAEALAEDLQRVVRGEPVMARVLPPLLQVWGWCRRHAGIGLLLGLNLVLLLLFTGAALYMRQWSLVDNHTLAGMVAKRLGKDGGQHSLKSIGLMVQNAAEDVRRVWPDDLPEPDAGAAEDLLRRIHASSQLPSSHWATVTNWVLMDRSANTVARWPLSPGLELTNRVYRDYFLGAMQRFATNPNAPVYVSDAYVSQEDDLLKIGVSIVVPGRDHTPQAVLAAMLETSWTNLVKEFGMPDHDVVLVARLDPSEEALQSARPNGSGPVRVATSPRTPAAPAWRIYGHPAGNMAKAGIPFPAAWTERDKLTFYMDPAGRRNPAYAWTPWLVGLARVPDTPFLVLVQSRDWIMVLLLPGVTLAIVTLVLLGRRSWAAQRR